MKPKQIAIRFYECDSESELEVSDRALVEIARKAALKAWAPYSRFYVGAAVKLENDEIITGNNQENAAFPIGLCAERVALFYANSLHPDTVVEAIAVAVRKNEEYTDMPVSPCGACRQALLEAEIRFGKPIRIIIFGKSKIQIFKGVENLLPLSFEPASLQGNFQER